MRIFLFVLCLILPRLALSQGTGKARGDMRILFYNAENLFDTIDDPGTDDAVFLPSSDKHWTRYRYWRKIKSIYKVIAAAGVTSPPEIIGLCEVENRQVLKDLCYHTPLSKYPWRIIHFDSPDRRGIDVAMIIRSDRVKLLDAQPIAVATGDSGSLTRDILHGTVLFNEDTLDVFVNHWPSRRGGEEYSASKRMSAARILRKQADSVISKRIVPRLIMMGDFNDEPGDSSIIKGLGAATHWSKPVSEALYNLSSSSDNSALVGTHKFNTEWSVFDQFMVSGSLLDNSGLYTNISGYSIIDFDFLLQPDDKYLGIKPFSTYNGIHYNGGFSDHLPVVLDLYLFKK